MDTDIREFGDGGLAEDHRELLNQLLDTWSVPVLERLCERPMRFNELRRAVSPITQKSLTATLRRLERNGIVERLIIRTRPVAIEYRITPLGKTLRSPIDALLEWVAAHTQSVAEARSRFDDESDATDASDKSDEQQS